MITKSRSSWKLHVALAASVGCLGMQVRPNYAAPAAGGPDFHVSQHDLSKPLSIIVYGDMRFTDPSQTTATNPKVRQWLVNQIAAEKPDAVLLSGDVPWHGSVPTDYDEYAKETEIWRESHLRVYPALGNHEISGGSQQQDIANWWKAFPELEGRRWYSVQLGDAVYILNLDSNSSLLADSEQTAWIESQLASLPKSIRFVFFNMHHPPVVDYQEGGDASHNGRPNEHALAVTLAASPQKSRVSFIVAAGHIHNYERMQQDGIVYLVSGGGGAKPVNVVRGPSDLYRDTEFPNYHYLRFVQKGKNLAATMFRVADPDASSPTWQEKDHFVVEGK